MKPTTEILPDSNQPTCQHQDGCTRPVRANGLCHKHNAQRYRQEVKERDPAQPRPETAANRMRTVVLACYQQHKDAGTLPTSSRFIFYELEAQGIIPKKYPPHVGGRWDGQEVERTPAADVAVALMYLRERGLVPWDDIRDETRSITIPSVTLTIADGVRSALEYTELTPWPIAENPRKLDEILSLAPVIICESRSLGGVLADLAREYHCSLAPTNGQCGGFLHTDIIPVLTKGHRVLYLGDLDFSGDHIEKNVQRVLEAELGLLDWERVALTQPQADERGLTPISKYDERDQKYHDAIETEALGQETIIGLLRTRLQELLPDSMYTNVRERAYTEREAIRVAIKGAL